VTVILIFNTRKRVKLQETRVYKKGVPGRNYDSYVPLTLAVPVYVDTARASWIVFVKSTLNIKIWHIICTTFQKLNISKEL
jgi:hypothetical protein